LTFSILRKSFLYFNGQLLHKIALISQYARKKVKEEIKKGDEGIENNHHIDARQIGHMLGYAKRGRPRKESDEVG